MYNRHLLTLPFLATKFIEIYSCSSICTPSCSVLLLVPIGLLPWTVGYYPIEISKCYSILHLIKGSNVMSSNEKRARVEFFQSTSLIQHFFFRKTPVAFRTSRSAFAYIYICVIAHFDDEPVAPYKSYKSQNMATIADFNAVTKSECRKQRTNRQQLGYSTIFTINEDLVVEV